MDYGRPEPLSPPEWEFFALLDDEIWTKVKDRAGGTHPFESRVLNPAEEERVLGIIFRKCLPVVLGSGPYAGLHVTIYDHAEYPGVKPMAVLALGHKHFEAVKDTTFATWDRRFEFFARFTHSDKNREMLSFYGLPLPQAKGHYEY